MIDRRRLLVALAAAGISPRIAPAQSKKAPIVIGWLHPGSRATNMRGFAAFKEGLGALGWKEGTNYVLEERWAEGQADRLPALAQELSTRKPAVIVAVLTPAVAAAARAAPGIPVVQASGSSPVNTKLAASLARPGGMVTGVTNVFSDVSEKYLELLLAAAPTVKRVGFLVDSATLGRDYVERARRAATQSLVEVRFAEAAKAEDIDSGMARLAKEGVQALVLLPGALFITERRRILKLALGQRWPVIGTSGFVEEGALLGYSENPVPRYRRAAWYVDRILQGAKPGDLPIEQPTKFELVVNLKTAKALGLSVPQPFLMRADRVIE